MPPTRLRGRYEIPIVNPAEESTLGKFLRDLGYAGSVFHVLKHVPEQGEDCYELLIDDHTVLGFEMDRLDQAIPPDTVETFSFKQYRDKIGQGKRRICLDQAAANARHLISERPRVINAPL